MNYRHQFHAGNFLTQVRQFFGGNQQFRVLLMAGLNVGEHFGRVQVVVALANLFERFRRLKTAARASANMIAAKQCPLRAGIDLEHVVHR